MNRTLTVLLGAYLAAACSSLRADIVTDWNNTLCVAAQTVVTKHNPGVPTRAMAMMNGSIYDVFQAVNRTHQPFKVDLLAPGASIDAAVSQAAYRVLSDMYPEVQSMLDTTLATRLAVVPNGAAKNAGINLGNSIAQQYITAHQNDGWSLPDAYTPTVGVGHWSTDPMLPTVQKGWGSDWGSVTPWAIPNADYFDAVTPFTIADMHTQRYTDAYNEVKEFGSRNSAARTAAQTQTGLFWAYDRPGTGAPPVMFIENMTDIGNQIGNSPADNARMFAQASVTLADSIIAAWNQKYQIDLWRPITGIRGGADDGNPNTTPDPTWEYLGAPGADPNSASDDFTPPFPAYVSGHATMGGAIFKTLEHFYGTNDFATADAAIGADPINLHYTLHSAEPGSGFVRDYYVRFTQEGPLGPGLENSPEGENSMSRIYLGVHWRMDQEDGLALGRAVADYVAANFFQPVVVPEPASSMLLVGALSALFVSRRSR
ncbi:MAG: vanadium-dependent haloperoxidase [Pirellulales bacterium]